MVFIPETCSKNRLLTRNYDKTNQKHFLFFISETCFKNRLLTKKYGKTTKENFLVFTHKTWFKNRLLFRKYSQPKQEYLLFLKWKLALKVGLKHLLISNFAPLACLHPWRWPYQPYPIYGSAPLLTYFHFLKKMWK